MNRGLLTGAEETAAVLQFPKDQVRFPLVQPDLDPFYFRMIPVVRPDRVTKRRSAVKAMDDAKSVHGRIRAAQPGVDRRHRLRPRHVMHIDFHKSAGRNIRRPLFFIAFS